MDSDPFATPPTGAAGEQTAPGESHHVGALHMLRLLEGKAVSAQLADTARQQIVMHAIGILSIHRISDDAVSFMLGDGVLMSVRREPPLHALFGRNLMFLESACIRLVIMTVEPPGPESMREFFDDLFNQLPATVQQNWLSGGVNIPFLP